MCSVGRVHNMHVRTFGLIPGTAKMCNLLNMLGIWFYKAFVIGNSRNRIMCFL